MVNSSVSIPYGSIPNPLPTRAFRSWSGGNSDATLRRVVAWGDGWYGFNLDGVRPLADLGVDELVIVDAPPADAAAAGDWGSTLADKWMSRRR